MLQGLPGLLLLLVPLLVVVRLLVAALLLPSMVHLTVRHHSSTLPPEHNTHGTVRTTSLIRLAILSFFSYFFFVTYQRTNSQRWILTV